jgi:hypothetical protein
MGVKKTNQVDCELNSNPAEKGKGKQQADAKSKKGQSARFPTLCQHSSQIDTIALSGQ